MAFDTSLALSIQAARTIDVGRGNGGGGLVPSGFVQFAESYYELSNLNKRIIHPRPSAETSAWAVSRLTYPGIKWRIPVEATGLAKPVHFSVSGPSGMAFSQSFPSLNAETGEYVDSQEVGMLEWDNPTLGDHEYTVTCRGQGGITDTLTVTSTLTVSENGIGFAAPTGDDSNPGTLASPKLTIEAFCDGNYGNYQVICRSGTYIPASNFITGGASQPKVLKGYPGETVTYNAQSSIFLMDGGDDISVSNIAFVQSNQNTAQSRFIYGTTNFNGNRLTIYDMSFDNFDVGLTGGDNPGPITILAPGQYHEDFVFRNLDLSNINNDSSSSLLGSWYQIRNAVANWVFFGTGMNASAGVLLKDGCYNFAVHNVKSIEPQLSNGAIVAVLQSTGGVVNDLIELSFNKISSDNFNDHNAIRHKQSTSDPGTPRIYIFRNNIKGRIGYGGSVGATSVVTINKNIIISDTDTTPIDPSINDITVIDENNIIGDSGDSYLDAQMDALESVDFIKGQRGANFYSGI